MPLKNYLLIFIFHVFHCYKSHGILYPKDSETRIVKSLDGIWNFRLSSPPDEGNLWYLKELEETGPTIPMPVPASYNDITVNKTIRDHVGVVWYDRTFFVPFQWQYNNRIWLRFGSVSYAAQVWINGVLAMTHEIGHLPFEAEITRLLKFGEKNLVTVAVDNTLLLTTVPQGSISRINAGNKTILKQDYTFDFFNYAGIDRPVLLYTTPPLYISGVTVVPTVSKNSGTVKYRINYEPRDNLAVSCEVSLIDKEGNIVATSENCTGNMFIESPNLWWPYLMHPDPGYLYTMKIVITDNKYTDIYRVRIGLRTVKWTNTELLINDAPVYIQGLGKHEDSDIRGKGVDLPVIIKDFELLKWLGVNTFRTSHYPYAEEIMDLADEMGIMVIDECPSVDTDVYSQTLLEKHKQSLTELIKRDSNRPSVIMWSAANEPRTGVNTSELYFKQIVEHIKSLDNTRPVTIVISTQMNRDHSAKFIDIICFNRYNSWYADTGITEVITQNIISEADRWFQRYQKPIIMSEYGADAMEGLHIYPEFVWSEEYQLKVLEESFKAFDELRRRGYFIGEMVWNFADFKTAQTITRVGGNRKGLFTRQRQPKPTAFLLRIRYMELAHKLYGAPFPEDLYRYTTSNTY